jgi:hypothetical protein
MEELMVSAVNGCWNKLWLEAFNDFYQPAG